MTTNDTRTLGDDRQFEEEAGLVLRRILEHGGQVVLGDAASRQAWHNGIAEMVVLIRRQTFTDEELAVIIRGAS